MGAYQRNDFSLGWIPSADAFSGPKNGLLRADNLVLDEIGAVSLRQGSAKINSAAFSDTDIHSLYTVTLGGTRYRMSGAANAVYANGTSIASSVNGSNDIYFGSHMGHILFARGTTKKKYDGTTVRNWGIAAPNAAPTVAAIAADSKVFASCAYGESPPFGSDEPNLAVTGATNATPIVITTTAAHGLATGALVGITGVGGNTAANGAWTITVISTTTFSLDTSVGNGAYTSGGTVGVFTTDKANAAGAALLLTPDSTTGRGTATKIFTSATDFTTYGGGQTGTDDDLIDFYAYITEPQYVAFITLMIDVNSSAAAATFQEDWYEYTFRPQDAIDVTPEVEETLASDYSVEGYDRDVVEANTEERESVVSAYRPDKPNANAGWNHFSIPRGKMDRHGLTAGKNWSTVAGVRVVVQTISGGSGAAVRIDAIQITGGTSATYVALTGKYKAAIVAVRNDSVYNALSAPSVFSSEIELKAQRLQVTVGAGVISALDSQVTELWLFLMGGRVNAFYRYTVKTGGPFAGAQTLEITSSDVAALVTNIRMETDNAAPPDTIIGIEGPHFDRTLCLTATHLYPSRERNPDSFSSGQAVRVGDASETALWIKKSNEQLYVGTTKDIYRFDGDWTELPDGTINVAKRPLGVTKPPVSAAVCGGKTNGVESVMYLASDGWTILQGPSLTDGAVDLLWRGETRHGVSPVNITASTARFRAAISKNVLFAVTPEGSDTTSSATIHAYHFGKQRWYRFTYPQAFRSLLSEPDGTLIAGDASGFVRTLDSATKQDDGVNIPVVLWTPVDDNGEPFRYKFAQNLSTRIDTGGVTASIALHVNGGASADNTVTMALTSTQTAVKDVTNTSSFSQIQQRITGSFSTFIYRGYELGYLDLPRPLLIHDTGFVDLSNGELQWVRRLWIKARTTVNMTVTPYWDGTAGTARTVTVGAYDSKEHVYAVPLGREDKGTTARVVITTTSPSHIYWVQFEMNASGKQRQKTFVFKQDIAA